MLRVHLYGEPPHLNPLLDADQTIHQVVDGLVYETLLRCEGDEYRPGLAERWEVSPDGLRVTLHLAPGIRWHDGRGFGVLDVQATLEPLLRPGAGMPLLRNDLADVAGMEIASDRVVRLRLKRPSDLALRALCDLPILPDHLIRGWNLEASPVTRQPVGTGPYRVAAWERGHRIRLVRARPQAGEGAALDEIVFEIDPDGARALAHARHGDLDVLPRVAEVHYPAEVAPATLRGALELRRLVPERASFLVVNLRRAGPLGDPRFRRALSMLWDRRRFAHEVHRDLARPVTGPLFGRAEGPTFDRIAARRLLDEAGYRDSDGDGVRDQGGKPIRLHALQPAGARSAAVEMRAFVLELRKAGILLDVESADPGPAAKGGLFGRLRSGDFDLTPLMWEGRTDEDPGPLFGSDGAWNVAGYRSASVDGLLDKLRRAGGPAARRAVLERIAGIVAADLPVIFLYRYDQVALLSRHVHDVAAVGEHLDLRRAWVDP